MHLISLVGAAGSGKNAVADVLIEHYDFRSISFAGCLKDAVASVFDWERRLLEGDTTESRKWRETIDPWWEKELSIPGFTPRYALQYVGTELFRQRFHPDMWLLTVKRRITNLGPDVRLAITDARFPNELAMTSDLGGKIVRVKRGKNPSWWEAALRNADDEYSCDEWGDILRDQDGYLLKTVHESERAWARDHYDAVIHNDGTLDDLRWATVKMMEDFHIAG